MWVFKEIFFFIKDEIEYILKWSPEKGKEDRHYYEHNLSLKKSLTQASPHQTPCFLLWVQLVSQRYVDIK